MAKHYPRQAATDTAISITGLNNNYPRTIITVSFYSDAEYNTPVTSGLSGSITAQYKPLGSNVYLPAENPLIELELGENQAFFSGTADEILLTPIGVTGAGYWQVSATAYDTFDVPSDFAKAFETSDRNLTALGVYVQDQTTQVLGIPFTKNISDITLVSDTTINDTSVTIALGSGVVVGNIVKLQSDTSTLYYFGRVLSVTTGANDVLSLDTPINGVYTSTDTNSIDTDDMLVDGSTTAQVFRIRPTPTQNGDTTRVGIVITATEDMDFSSFGADPALTKGCVLRVKRENGSYTNIFNWKNNGQFTIQSFDTLYQSPKQGNSIRGLSSRITFSGAENYGVTVRLDGSRDEELEVVIQDNLTGGTNQTFTMFAQGHEVQ